MIEILSTVKNIWKSKGVVGFVVGCKTRSGHLGHGDDTGHQLLHIFIFRSKLSVWEDLDLDSSICAFFDHVRKFSHGNMNCVCFTESVGECQHQWVLCGCFCACFRTALCTAGKAEQSQAQSGCDCCNFSHFLISPF